MVSFFYIRVKIHAMHAVIIIILILAILLVIFTLQNSFEISINVFFWEINNAPLVLVLIVCIVLGYLLGAIYLYPQLWQLKKDKKRLKRNQADLEKQSGYYPEETDPEGIDLTDDDDLNKNDDNSFFRE